MSVGNAANAGLQASARLVAAPRRRSPALACALLLSTACSAPLVPVFATSGDAPSRTGLVRTEDGALFGNAAGRVYRLDAEGRPRWVVETGAEVRLPPALAGAVVGVVAGADTLVALDAETGRELWRAGGQPEPVALAAAAGRLVTLGLEGELRAFRAEAGGMPSRRAWNASLGIRPGAPPVGLVPVDDAVLAVGPAAALLLSAADGALRWKAPLRQPTGVVRDGALLWAAERAGRLVAIESRAGTVLRTVPLAAGAGVTVGSPPSVALGRVWVGLSDGSLVGIDVRREAPPFRASLPSPLVGGVTEWRDRVLVPTSGREGRLLAIDLQRPGSPASARVDSPLRTAPLARGDVAWQLAADGRVLGFRLR